MIQRPQTILLLLAVLSIVLTFIFPLWIGTTEGTEYFLTVWESAKVLENGTKEVLKVNYHVFVFGFILLGVLLLAVFKYNNRLLQMKICSASSLVIMGYFFVIYMWSRAELIEISQTAGANTWVIFMPFAAAIFVMIAKILIQRDEKLVRSVDRMR